MNPRILSVALTAAILLGASALAQSVSDLQGKWTLKKKSTQFSGEVTQDLEIKQDTFKYKVTSVSSGSVVLAASGKLKVEKVGPFKVMKLTDIVGGYSETDQQAVNDDRDIVYLKGWDTLTLGLNFDRERDGEDTVADTYTKVSAK